MAFENRLEQLCNKATENYNEILQGADFIGLDTDDVEELAEKIIMAKWIHCHMTNCVSGNPTDIEALLFYEKPVTATFEYFCENNIGLMYGLLDPMAEFIQHTKYHIKELMNMWDALPLDELQRAENYMAMNKVIANYFETHEQEPDDDMEH